MSHVCKISAQKHPKSVSWLKIIKIAFLHCKHTLLIKVNISLLLNLCILYSYAFEKKHLYGTWETNTSTQNNRNSSQNAVKSIQNNRKGQLLVILIHAIWQSTCPWLSWWVTSVKWSRLVQWKWCVCSGSTVYSWSDIYFSLQLEVNYNNTYIYI